MKKLLALEKLFVLSMTLLGSVMLQDQAAIAQEILTQRYNVYIQRDKLTIFEKTTKELNTAEGRALIQAAGQIFGLPADTINFGIAETAKFVVPNYQQDRRGLINSPAGYTICYAVPTNLNTPDHGIETHGDTTFNTTILRVTPGSFNDDGLAWYMSIPLKATTDTRVAGSFDIYWVKANPGWQERYKQCRPTGEHPWLSRNKDTKLNVP